MKQRLRSTQALWSSGRWSSAAHLAHQHIHHVQQRGDAHEGLGGLFIEDHVVSPLVPRESESVSARLSSEPCTLDVTRDASTVDCPDWIDAAAVLLIEEHAWLFAHPVPVDEGGITLGLCLVLGQPAAPLGQHSLGSPEKLFLSVEWHAGQDIVLDCLPLNLGAYHHLVAAEAAALVAGELASGLGELPCGQIVQKGIQRGDEGFALLGE